MSSLTTRPSSTSTTSILMTSPMAGNTRNKTDGYRDLHKEGRKDVHKKDAEGACDELEKAPMGIHAPVLDFELGIDMSDEKMLKYLELMNEHFCSHGKEHEDTWTDCDLHTETHKAQKDKCDDLQEDFEDLRPLALQRPQVHPHQVSHP
eukprot:1746604-Amphidinium_carterae.1